MSLLVLKQGDGTIFKALATSLGFTEEQGTEFAWSNTLGDVDLGIIRFRLDNAAYALQACEPRGSA